MKKKKKTGEGDFPRFRHFLVNTHSRDPIDTRNSPWQHHLFRLSLSLSLLFFPSPCESTPQVDTQTRGTRFKGSLTSDRGFFSSVKQRVRFRSIWLTGKAMMKAERGRERENERRRGRQQRKKKKITSAAWQRSPSQHPHTHTPPFPPLSLSSFSVPFRLATRANFYEIQPSSSRPFSSFQEPLARFRRQPTRG